MTVTPDQARELLDGEGETLTAAAPDLAQNIAGMTEVWAVEEQADDGGWWRITTWHKRREDLDAFHDRSGHRLVRRLVGPVEVAEGERLSVCGFL